MPSLLVSNQLMYLLVHAIICASMASVQSVHLRSRRTMMPDTILTKPLRSLCGGEAQLSI
jgi:hypothetical protein